MLKVLIILQTFLFYPKCFSYTLNSYAAFYHKLMNNFRYFHTFIRIFIKNTKDIYIYEV